MASSGATKITKVLTAAVGNLARWKAGGELEDSGVAGSSVGTVSSVGITAPAIFTVSGSPVTGSGAITLTLATQTANAVFAGPTTGSAAAPTFRALVAADVPTLTLAKISDAGTAAALASDTDTTLAANSDSRVATQKATKAYVDGAVTGLLDFKGSTNCAGNPNYPAASKGDAYVVSTAGKIGGLAGTSVDVGDVYVAKADNAGGTQSSVGTSWFVLEHNLVGALLTANNLSDLTDAAAARTNLSLGPMALQNSSSVAITGGTISGITISISDGTLDDIATFALGTGGTYEINGDGSATLHDLSTDGLTVLANGMLTLNSGTNLAHLTQAFTVDGLLSVGGLLSVSSTGTSTMSGSLSLAGALTVSGAITHTATRTATGTISSFSGTFAYDDSGTNVNRAFAFYPTFNYTSPVSTTTSVGVRVSAYAQSVHASSTNYVLSLGTNTAAAGAGTHSDLFAFGTDGKIVFSADTTANLYRFSSGTLRTDGNLSILGSFSSASPCYFPAISGGSSSDSTLQVSTVNFTAAGTMVKAAQGAFSNSSGLGIGLDVQVTASQSSTASFTALRVTPFLNTTGSGSKLLIDLGTNSAGSGGGTHTTVSNCDSAGGWVIGSGQRLKKVLSATATLDFGSIGAASYADLTISVTGAAVGDVVAIGAPNGSVAAGFQFTGWVSSADTVTVRATNLDASSHDPASGTFRATVFNF